MIDYANIGTIIGARAAIAHVVADGEQTISQFRGALAKEEMHSAGLGHLVDVLLAELKAAAPTHRLFKQTGKRYDTGRPQTQLSLLYEAKFDEAGRKRGVTFPEYLRSRAR